MVWLVVVRSFRPCRVKLINIFGLVRWCLWKNTQLTILLVEKGLRQEGHLAVKSLLQNIVVRNNGTGTLSEGVANGRAGENVRPVRYHAKSYRKDLNYELHP